MTATLVSDDRAELIAESLDIPPVSYAGRTGDAIVAMTLVAGYRRLIYADQEQVLDTISERIGFGQFNPGFVDACRNSLALMIANPVWIPGSLSNDELEKEITFWRNVSKALVRLDLQAVAISPRKASLSLGRSEIILSMLRRENPWECPL